MPDVSVVIPYYDGQSSLDLLLAALELQDTASSFEVVVADDGSPTPPVPGERPWPVHVVRQDDEGFRAAAARNLGARHATGRVLVFLDGDMVPEPGYLSALEEALADSPDDTLVVGHRRHADLAGWNVDSVRAWLDGSGPAPTPLGDPQWLADGHRATDDLRTADDRSYRFVISAVMATPRDRFERVGGFVEFSGYGGEDWEFAHRWRHHGGRFRHAPDAVAWQDGVDFGGRHDADERRRIKDEETLRLAPLLPLPGARDPRLVWRVPQIAVVADATGLSAAQALEFLACLLDGSDAAVWVSGLAATAWQQLEDARLRRADASGPAPGQGSPEESTWVADVHRPGALRGTTLAEVVARVGDTAWHGGPAPSHTAGASLTVRHVPTGRRWPVDLPEEEWVALPGQTVRLEDHWSRGL